MVQRYKHNICNGTICLLHYCEIFILIHETFTETFIIIHSHIPFCSFPLQEIPLPETPLQKSLLMVQPFPPQFLITPSHFSQQVSPGSETLTIMQVLGTISLK